MFGVSRYVQTLLFLCVCSTLASVALILFINLPTKNSVKANGSITPKSNGNRVVISKNIPSMFRRYRNFTDEQINNMSSMGKWLFDWEEKPPLSEKHSKKDPYLILIWKYGAFLERRHIKRYTQEKFSPWTNCTVKNCKLTYRDEDIHKADAVVFHLHLTKSMSDIPLRLRLDQRWIFLTDESPMHTFMHRKQNLVDYNGLFNWSMSYRSDSDIPVPYGRTVAKLNVYLPNETFWQDDVAMSRKIKTKTKLVAIMGSNCGSSNNRWEYVKILKSILGDNLDIYGKCLGGNTTACPGHFAKDCPALNAYKFYLAFENSNCREYLTEKVFWNAYEKFAVPIIMGPPKKDCELLLPPRSFLHISDFATPCDLARYIQYLGRYNDKYLEYQEWRKYYKVINEHGYFGSVSRHYCRICEALHYNSPQTKVYEDLRLFWNKDEDCIF